MSEQAKLELRKMTMGPNHHSFGYYDKCPWDATGRYLLALAMEFMDRPPGPSDVVVVGMVDLNEGNRWVALDRTCAWNWQQGTMLQWLESAPDRLIVYNAREGDRFVSIVRDVHSGQVRALPRPVYAVSRDGRQAVSLNFSRVHRCRPGYGYAGIPDPWEDDAAPEDDGIYWLDLETGENRLVVSIARVAEFRPQPSMEGAKHWFNHLQFNTDGSRFLFLHRWRTPDGGWFTRLFTANPDGSGLYCVADHELVSHFDWKNERQILAWARQHGEGDFFYLFTDRSDEKEIVGRGILTQDGHCSYSPDRTWILSDTYPDERDMRTLILYRPSDKLRVDVGSFYSSPHIRADFRCDLHPRWNRDGTQICFDSIHEGERQLYAVNVSEIAAD